MGIDIYTRWPGQSEDEQAAQITGFDVTKGSVGYLREAYHGEPYVTQYLVREAFDAPNCRAQIPAAVLRDRLPKAVELAVERARVVYGEANVGAADVVVQSFVQFVELCERKERETGEPVTIVASY